MKTIGVLTSGGDAPGMNATVRAVVRTAIAKGMTVKGIMRGYNGLIEDDVIDLTLRGVADIIHRGGTILYTARSEKFKTDEGVTLAVETCKKHGIEGVVVIGGDGSFRGAAKLSEFGIPTIGIPGTIDNDICCSEYTIGFDTAMNTAMEMIDKIRDTAQSHDRCSVVEVMGRHAGHVALQTGIATGASVVLVPEVKYDIKKDVIDVIKAQQATGKKHFIVVVAEGVGGVEDIAKTIQQETDVESRATVLGHVQRGGNPTVRDRIMAAQMGHKAVCLLSDGIGNRVISFRNNTLVDDDIHTALSMEKDFDYSIFKTLVQEISI